MDFDEIRRAVGILDDDPIDADVRELSASAERMLDDFIRIRKLHGLRQVDVAETLGVDGSTISKFESGERDPRLSTIRRYAVAVGAMVDFSVTESSRYLPQNIIDLSTCDIFTSTSGPSPVVEAVEATSRSSNVVTRLERQVVQQ